jgi:putative FmdB family regulatory protein
MPIYCYRCRECEHGFETFQFMHADRYTVCSECGDENTLDIVPQPAASPNQAFRKPIELHSLGLCNDEDIADFRRRNPDVPIGTDPAQDDYGVPKARSRQEKKKILETEGFVELNGYN